jgi:hypothetical protein
VSRPTDAQGEITRLALQPAEIYAGVWPLQDVVDDHEDAESQQDRQNDKFVQRLHRGPRKRPASAHLLPKATPRIVLFVEFVSGYVTNRFIGSTPSVSPCSSQRSRAGNPSRPSPRPGEHLAAMSGTGPARVFRRRGCGGLP